MRPNRRRRLRSVRDAPLRPARLYVERHGELVPVMIGISAGHKTRMLAELIAEWLSETLGLPFVESRPNSGGNLAVEAFYDELNEHFRDGVFVAIIGSVNELPSTASVTARLGASFVAEPESVGLLAEIEPINLKCHGLVHAFFNEATARTQVTFDCLPGTLEFVGRSPAPARRSCAAMPAHHREATASYSLGIADGNDSEVLERLSKIIGQRTSHQASKIRLGENV